MAPLRLRPSISLHFGGSTSLSSTGSLTTPHRKLGSAVLTDHGSAVSVRQAHCSHRPQWPRASLSDKGQRSKVPGSVRGTCGAATVGERWAERSRSPESNPTVVPLSRYTDTPIHRYPVTPLSRYTVIPQNNLAADTPQTFLSRKAAHEKKSPPPEQGTLVLAF